MGKTGEKRGGQTGQSVLADRDSMGGHQSKDQRVGVEARQTSKKGQRVSDTPALRRSSGGPSFFEMYKPSQGYYTRLGTAIGGGVLALGLGKFVYDNLAFDQSWTPGMYLKVGIPAMVVVALGVLIWWVVGVHRRSCDFMIATDGEMKKVNWSTRREVIASTKVVIVVTLLMAGILFVIDLGFMNFFRLIGVLRSGGEGLP